MLFAAVEQAGLPMIAADPRQADNLATSANAVFSRTTGHLPR